MTHPPELVAEQIFAFRSRRPTTAHRKNLFTAMVIVNSSAHGDVRPKLAD
jgi:hypothetical protein